MRKIIIAFVLGLFLIPSFVSAQTSSSAARNSYWNRLNSLKRTNRSALKEARTEIQEKKVDIRTRFKRRVKPKRIDRESILDFKVEGDFSDSIGNVSPPEASGEYDAAREDLKMKLEEIKKKIADLRAEEKRLREELRNWKKDKKESWQEERKEKKEEFREKKELWKFDWAEKPKKELEEDFEDEVEEAEVEVEEVEAEVEMEVEMEVEVPSWLELDIPTERSLMPSATSLQQSLILSPSLRKAKARNARAKARMKRYWNIGTARRR